MDDYAKKYRKKNKFIFELRYDPRLMLLDAKGSIIGDIEDSLKSRYPSWKVNQSEIVFSDVAENPKDEYLLGMKRTSVVVEDISTFEDFKNNVTKLMKLSYKTLSLSSIRRMGFRIISTYSMDNIRSFNDAREKIEEKFLKDPIDLGLKHRDLMIKIVHDNGFYTVGPVKDDENWIKQNFKDLSDARRIVKHGYGLDIDSYGNNIDVPDEKSLISKVMDTLKLSKSIEDAIIRSLES